MNRRKAMYRALTPALASPVRRRRAGPGPGRPDRASPRRAEAADLHRDRRAQREDAAAHGRVGAQGRAQRGDRPHRRPGLRRHQHLRRPHQDRGARPPRAARASLQQLPHHGAFLADARGAQVRPQPPHGEHGLHHRDGDGVPGRHRVRSPTRPHRSPRRCGSTAMRPAPSASGTRRPPGRPASPARTTAGRRARASTSSTASSGARRTSGRRTCTTASRRSSCRTTRTTTS